MFFESHAGLCDDQEGGTGVHLIDNVAMGKLQLQNAHDTDTDLMTHMCYPFKEYSNLEKFQGGKLAKNVILDLHN